MGKKKPSAPPPDYQKLWSSYNKWQQEDEQWYESAKAEQTLGADVGDVKARMARSGLKSGSAEWQAKIDETLSKRPDIEAQYAAKQADLKGSLTYQDLVKGHQASEGNRQRAWDAKQFGSNPLESMKAKREYGSVTGTAPTYAAGAGGLSGMMEQQKRNEYQQWKAGGSKPAGANISGMQQTAQFEKFQAIESDPFKAQGFQEWGETTYGNVKAENTYETAPSAQESATARAKTAARGRRGGSAGSGISVSRLEDNPWA